MPGLKVWRKSARKQPNISASRTTSPSYSQHTRLADRRQIGSMRAAQRSRRTGLQSPERTMLDSNQQKQRHSNRSDGALTQTLKPFDFVGLMYGMKPVSFKLTYTLRRVSGRIEHDLVLT